MNAQEANNKATSSKILVTAGPTIEPLDPVRFISNYSTGMMGYEIAARFKEKGFDVCLVSGPVQMAPPFGVEVVNVTTACEMRDKVVEIAEGCACLVMTAAVCDFRPERVGEEKIKKKETMELKLVKNPDILAELKEKRGLIKIGFALETENAVENGKEKLRAKNLDMIIVNTKKDGKDPFGPGEKDLAIIDKSGNVTEVSGVDKRQFAEVLVERAKELL